MPHHKLYVSNKLKTWVGKVFVAESKPYAMLLSALLSVTHPKLYDAPVDTINRLGELDDHREAIAGWLSAFSRFQMISNWTSEDHQDLRSRAEWYDILASVGPYRKGVIKLRNLGAQLQLKTFMTLGNSQILMSKPVGILVSQGTHGSESDKGTYSCESEYQNNYYGYSHEYS
jgi:hypothetical protein